MREEVQMATLSVETNTSTSSMEEDDTENRAPMDQSGDTEEQEEQQDETSDVLDQFDDGDEDNEETRMRRRTSSI